MSNVEQGENHATMQQLKEEIRRLREQQSAAEKIAGLVGMTTDESEQYRERNNRIKSLTSQLAVLDSEQKVALHEQNETQTIPRQSAKGAQADRAA
jgi:superfamily I DNA and RNA helicase